MNTNKIQLVDTPTESSMIQPAREGGNNECLSINTPMTHLSLSTTPLNTIDTMPVTQHDQTTTTTEENDRQEALNQQVQQSLRQQTQDRFSRRTEPVDSERHNYHQQESKLDDIIQLMNDDEENDIFLEMDNLEKFYADERWKKGGRRLTESEQHLLVQQIKSILNDALKSSASASLSLHPTRKIPEMEYYNLTKLLELIENDIEQSENIQIAATIMKNEAEDESDDGTT
jgi:hypothetical protein